MLNGYLDLQDSSALKEDAFRGFRAGGAFGPIGVLILVPIAPIGPIDIGLKCFRAYLRFAYLFRYIKMSKST